jgi:hypothetical protein
MPAAKMNSVLASGFLSSIVGLWRSWERACPGRTALDSNNSIGNF